MLTPMVFSLLLSGCSPAAVDTRPADQNEDPITIRATGWARARQDLTGPRARLMAERGAQVVAARNLLVRLQELGIETASPRRGSGRLHGHRYSRAIFLEDGTAMVTAEITLNRRQARAYRRANLAVVPIEELATRAAGTASHPASQPAQAATRPAPLVP